MNTHYCRVGKITPNIEKETELKEAIRAFPKDIEDSNETNGSEVLD